MNGSEFQELWRALHELIQRVYVLEQALQNADIDIPVIKEDEDE